MELLALKSYYTQRDGLVVLEDDVLSIVRQVREDHGDKVSIQLDPLTGHYHFVEHCEDHTDRLIFTVEELDARALQRLREADSTSPAYEDTYDRAEREQDELQEAIHQRGLEKVQEAGERLAWAMGDGKHGPGMHQSIHIKEDIS